MLNSLNSWHIVLLLFSVLYCFIHSLLASNSFKHYINKLTRGKITNKYRLIYNFIALIGLLPITIILFAHPGAEIWDWPHPMLMNIISVFAIVGFLYTLKYYNASEFIGISAFKETTLFVISPLHRFVRHPWYFLALIIIWCRDINIAYLITAGVFTLYFILGSYLEEKKLIEIFGSKYEFYQQNVPMLIPNPFRFLSISDLSLLTQKK